MNIVDNDCHFEKVLLIEVVRTIGMVNAFQCLLFLTATKDHAVNLFIAIKNESIFVVLRLAKFVNEWISYSYR